MSVKQQVMLGSIFLSQLAIFVSLTMLVNVWFGLGVTGIMGFVFSPLLIAVVDAMD